jgi:hypothetical protein
MPGSVRGRRHSSTSYGGSSSPPRPRRHPGRHYGPHHRAFVAHAAILMPRLIGAILRRSTSRSVIINAVESLRSTPLCGLMGAPPKRSRAGFGAFGQGRLRRRCEAHPFGSVARGQQMKAASTLPHGLAGPTQLPAVPFQRSSSPKLSSSMSSHDRLGRAGDSQVMGGHSLSRQSIGSSKGIK